MVRSSNENYVTRRPHDSSVSELSQQCRLMRVEMSVLMVVNQAMRDQIVTVKAEMSLLLVVNRSELIALYKITFPYQFFRNIIKENSLFLPFVLSFTMAVLMDPSFRLMSFPILSIYASAPLGNIVPPPGNLNLSPSYIIQFCTAFSTVRDLCGAFKYQA